MDESANAESMSSRSVTPPTTSARTTGGSCLITGIWLTPYSRRMAIASRTVSSGCVWTSVGSDASRAANMSSTVGPASCMNP